MGKALPECVNSDGAQTFLMDYLSWKYSMQKILPQGTHCQPEMGYESEESLHACSVGFRVELPGQGVGLVKLL